MSMLLTIWKTHLKSTYNALRSDTRMRVTWCIALVLDFAAGAWSVNTLIVRLAQWHAAGSTALVDGLWVVCFIGWAGIGLFSVLATLQLGFGNLGMGSDASLLLMTLPIPPATRFRALYGLMFFEGIGNWLLLEMSIMGIALTSVLGWQVLIWLALLLTGTGVVVWCSMVVTLLVIRYIVPHLRRVLRVVIVVGLGLIFVGIPGHFLGFAVMAHRTGTRPLPFHPAALCPYMSVCPTPSTQVDNLLSVLSGLHNPGLSAILFVLLLIVLVGPLGNRVGRLYIAAFHTLEGRAGSVAVFTLPGVRPIINVIGRYRNLTGALFYKGLLNQSRHPFTWARLIIVLVGLLLFSLIRNLFVHYAFSHVFLVAIYSSILAILTIMELAPYAISSEGNRLALYLVDPLKVGSILRARLMVFLSAAFFVGLVSCGVLSSEVGLSWVELLSVIMIILLIIVGYTAFVVCGSAFDEDLNLAVEGRMETLFQEELPFTPRRMQLLGLSLLLLALMLFLVWKLSVMLAIAGLLLLDGVVLVGMWHVSCMYLGRLLRRG